MQPPQEASPLLPKITSIEEAKNPVSPKELPHLPSFKDDLINELLKTRYFSEMDPQVVQEEVKFFVRTIPGLNFDELSYSTHSLLEVLSRIARSKSLQRIVTEKRQSLMIDLQKITTEVRKRQEGSSYYIWKHTSTLPEYRTDVSRRFAERVSIPASDDPVWKEMESWVTDNFDLFMTQIFPNGLNALSAEEQQKYNNFKEAHNDRFLKDVLAGTVNLVNAVAEYAVRQHPIKTIVFLDKSARNASILFRVMLQEATSSGLINDALHPQIKYLNVGTTDDKSKTHYPIPVSEYLDIDTSGGVLIVDEFSVSGDSMREAAGFIRQAHPDVSPPFIDTLVQFLNIPPWYGHRTAGVTDHVETEEYKTTKQYLHKIEPELLHPVRVLTSDFGRNIFAVVGSELMSSDMSPTLHQLSAERSFPYEQQVTQFFEEMKKRGLTAEEFTQLSSFFIDYFKLAGGLFASPPLKEDRKEILLYRKFLRVFMKEFCRRWFGKKDEIVQE